MSFLVFSKGGKKRKRERERKREMEERREGDMAVGVLKQWMEKQGAVLSFVKVGSFCFVFVSFCFCWFLLVFVGFCVDSGVHWDGVST